MFMSTFTFTFKNLFILTFAFDMLSFRVYVFFLRSVFLLEHSFDGHCLLFCLDEMLNTFQSCLFVFSLEAVQPPVSFDLRGKSIFVCVYVCFVAVNIFCHGTLACFLWYFCPVGGFRFVVAESWRSLSKKKKLSKKRKDVK